MDIKTAEVMDINAAICNGMSGAQKWEGVHGRQSTFVPPVKYRESSFSKVRIGPLFFIGRSACAPRNLETSGAVDRSKLTARMAVHGDQKIILLQGLSGIA